MDVFKDWHVCLCLSKFKVKRLFPVIAYGPLWTENVHHAQDVWRVPGLMCLAHAAETALSPGDLHFFCQHSKSAYSEELIWNVVFQFWNFMRVSEACISVSLYLSPLHRWFQQLELASLQMMPDAPSLAGSFSSHSPTYTQNRWYQMPPQLQASPKWVHKYAHLSNTVALHILNKRSQVCFHKVELAWRTLSVASPMSNQYLLFSCFAPISSSLNQL